MILVVHVGDGHTFPRVSGIQTNVKAKASRQKAAKKIYVPQEIEANISGVTRPMILWHSHVSFSPTSKGRTG
jgi:hypothetical protein